jgi:hypothetical protein
MLASSFGVLGFDRLAMYGIESIAVWVCPRKAYGDDGTLWVK